MVRARGCPNGVEGDLDAAASAVFETDWSGNLCTTSVFWNVPPSYIMVNPTNDWVDGNFWPMGDITLTIDDPDNGPGVDYTETQTTNESYSQLEIGGSPTA